MTEFADDFSWWESALKGVRGPIHDGEAKSGYYRSKNKDKSLSAWAYWIDSKTGEQRCQCDGRNVDEQRALEQFPYCSKQPITSEMFWHKIETGVWPDVDETVAAASAGPEIDPQQDPVASIKKEIDTAVAGVAKYAKIESDEDSAKAQTLRSTLTGLKGKAEKAYEVANRPLLDQQKAIRETWFPLRDTAEANANALRKAMGLWEDDKRAQAKLAADAAANALREHEAAVAAAAAKDEPAPPPPPVVTPNTPAPSAQIRGGSGRAASVSTKPFVVSIDPDKAFQHFKADTALIEFLTRLTQKAAEAGITVEGTIIEHRSVVR